MRRLDLSAKNPKFGIGSAGMVAISGAIESRRKGLDAMLATNPNAQNCVMAKLLELDLSYCRIGDAGMRAFCDAMKTGAAMLSLDVDAVRAVLAAP